jgi:hypothetical protein
VNEHQLSALRSEVQALLQQLRVHDQHLAASQGAVKALELVVNCMLLTHQDPKAVLEMISHNAPKLLEGTPQNDPAGATLRAILGNAEGTITGELARRTSKSVKL